MHIPQRILRAEVDDLPGERARRSTRDLETQDRILRAAQYLFARHGRASFSLTDLTVALRMSPATLRRQFCDLESILAEIILRHLHAIAVALGKVPFDAPNAHAARRAAYLAYTRTAFNAPTEAHLLLVRDRLTLPPDLAEPIEATRHVIGDLVAGPDAAIALVLLDATELQGGQIETILANLHPPATIEPAPPAPPPAIDHTPIEKRLFTPPRLLALEAPDDPQDDLILLGRHTPPSTRHARAGPQPSLG